jgi:hypothetical protein
MMPKPVGGGRPNVMSTTLLVFFAVATYIVTNWVSWEAALGIAQGGNNLSMIPRTLENLGITVAFGALCYWLNGHYRYLRSRWREYEEDPKLAFDSLLRCMPSARRIALAIPVILAAVCVIYVDRVACVAYSRPPGTWESACRTMSFSTRAFFCLRPTMNWRNKMDKEWIYLKITAVDVESNSRFCAFLPDCRKALITELRFRRAWREAGGHDSESDRRENDLLCRRLRETELAIRMLDPQGAIFPREW